ncbi:MAG: hypothetical protein H6Q70_1323 [Firmicutes bacterium]|nr:hypothetical protein [Bacillota bacterium]
MCDSELSKDEVMKVVLSYFKQFKNGQFNNFVDIYINKIREEEKTKSNVHITVYGHSSEETKKLNEFKPILTEVIWDLIVERVLTPGIYGEDFSKGLSSLRVSNRTKFNEKLLSYDMTID